MAFRIDLPAQWITGPILDVALAVESGGPHRSMESTIAITIPVAARMMVDAAVRLLSVANQLVHVGKSVTLNFASQESDAYSYLNRVGFFDALDQRVHVRPSWPAYSAAALYQGGNRGLVEIARIRPDKKDQGLPSRLEAALVESMKDGPRKEMIGSAAYSLIGELVGNVYDHSKTPLDGYAVLQVYKNGNCAKIAVSDSGQGLLDTLRPSLPVHYPRLVGLGDAELMMHAFREGISRHGKGHGAGLKLCAEKAVKLSANLEVRLPVSCVRVIAKQGALRPATAHLLRDMPLLWGSHLVFDFRLD